MKILLAGGTGQIGQSLIRHFLAQQHEITVLSRHVHIPSHTSIRSLQWDGEILGPWAEVINEIDVVINLAGRTVNCRYTEANLKQMMDSRVNSTRVIGQALEQATKPPQVWLQMSTATIYAHRFDTPHDEDTGAIGGDEANVPDYWSYSVDIAQAWEREQTRAHTPKTRKVCLRAAMTMTPDLGGIFDTLYRLTRLGLGGSVAGGKQMVSWIHEDDFITALDLLIHHDTIAGPINLCAPHPLSQGEFMRTLRQSMKVKLGLPATKWMAEIGAFVMRTDTELLLKSRYVIPTRLIELGMEFKYPSWPEATRDLVSQRQSL